MPDISEARDAGAESDEQGEHDSNDDAHSMPGAHPPLHVVDGAAVAIGASADTTADITGPNCPS